MAALCSKSISRAEFDEQLLHIKAFEQTLAEEGALILKFWLHLSKYEKTKQLAKVGKDPLVGLHASDSSWNVPDSYNAHLRTAGYAIRATMSGNAPWFIVEGGDANFRRESEMATLTERLAKHLKQRAETRVRQSKLLAKERKRDDKLRRKARKARNKDQSRWAIAGAGSARTRHAQHEKNYERQRLRRRRFIASRSDCTSCNAARAAGLSTVLVFEGWDAAGKGGAIRRMTFTLNARDYRIVWSPPPTDEERANHHLWRFWCHLGRAGQMTIFDRRWYGRVLVERVEHLAPEEAWMRAYGEINDFEAQLAENKTLIVKVWLHLTKDEQLRRFKQRPKSQYKKWKLTEDDWRNRDKWDAHEDAVNDMVSRTSTTAAPWTLIAANDKRYA